MAVHVNVQVGRNDPCPCGSGKKYKRCCLEQRNASYGLWARQRDASDELTREMMRFAALKFGHQIGEAWQDFHATDLPLPFDERSHENQIFMPYFLFHWDPQRRRSGKGAATKGGIVARWFMQERAGKLSELERLFLVQATTQPVTFFEVLWTDPNERIGLKDILLGTETEVFERSASRSLRNGDIVYGQVWKLQGLSILGSLAPIGVPPSWKAEVFELRKKLRRMIAKQNRDLDAEDLVRYADRIRLTYLIIRDALNLPPRLANTDGDPLVFHTLKFRIESPEAAFEALAPLAMGRSKEDLLAEAEFDETGRLRAVNFDWLKQGNKKIPTWDNTILGSINISRGTLIAEVNSKKRAKQLRDKIEKQLGANATHQRTVARAADEMLAKSPRQDKMRAKDEQTVDDILHDPEVRKKIQEEVQKQTEAWACQKIPILGGRTPMEAVRDPDGREIVESLLLDSERRADEGVYQPGIRPDFNSVRKLLKLMPRMSSDVPS
jgi:SEC-C motif